MAPRLTLAHKKIEFVKKGLWTFVSARGGRFVSWLGGHQRFEIWEDAFGVVDKCVSFLNPLANLRAITVHPTVKGDSVNVRCAFDVHPVRNIGSMRNVFGVTQHVVEYVVTHAQRGTALRVVIDPAGERLYAASRFLSSGVFDKVAYDIREALTRHLGAWWSQAGVFKLPAELVLVIAETCK